MKQSKHTAAALLAALLLTGCAENPGTDLIAHKDIENLISEAQQTDERKADLAELTESEHYTADFENESLHVKVHANAAVDVPQTEQLSMYRVSQRRFTQEDCDRVRSFLMGNAPLTDCTKLIQMQTKAEIEEILSDLREAVAEEQARLESDPDYAANIGTTGDELRAEWQRSIDKWQAKYEAAADSIDYASIPHDGRLAKNADLIAQEADKNGFWHSYCRHMEDGDTLWACTQDETAMLHVQNSDAFSNVMWYSAAPNGFQNTGTYMIELRPLDELSQGEEEAEPLPGETAELSRADAEQKAAEFLKAVGAEDFICCEGERLTAAETLTVQKHSDFREKEHTYARTYWVLRYYRTISGAPLEQSSGTKKTTDSDKSDEFREKIWPAEVIELRINDSGIVQMSWNAPLEITETVVENAAMKPFSEITDAFERMLPMTAAEAELNTEISIESVSLSYSRISEKDDFDTGMIVPVWAFRGTRKVTGEDYFDQHLSFTGVQLALNAIDGSVINAELGY